ncbi:DUF4198 domain-containing protein [Virgibacillus kimchii]
MKKIVLFTGLMLTFSLFIFSKETSAHELFIQVEEFPDSKELRVDVIWGHIRDFVDQADVEDLALYVQYPDENTEQLDLEAIGVQARSYVSITEDGTYTFWATREPSTYTPDDGVTQLSDQAAKLVHHVGGAGTSGNDTVEMELEIVPETETHSFSTGTFTGNILLNGELTESAIISAYGPEWEVLETTSDEDGQFELDFGSSGEWLIKANLELDESGTVDGEDYETHSFTSTFLIDTEQEQVDTNESSLFSLVGMLLSGLLIGAAVTIFIMRKK